MLNKENKYLFGELLDRPRSKPKELGPQNETFRRLRDIPLDGIQSELTWHKSKQAESAQHSQSPDQSRPKLNPSMVTAQESLSIKAVGPGLDLRTTFPESTLQTRDNAGVVGNNKNKNVFVSTRPRHEPSLSTRLVDAAMPTQPYIQIPDKIFRNILHYPLAHRQRAFSKADEAISLTNVSKVCEKYIHYPSVTKILNTTMPVSSKVALERWKKKMIAKLGQKGFTKYQDGLLWKDREFHRTIFEYFSGVRTSEFAMDPDVSGCWQSLSSVIPSLTRIRALECHVVHSNLMYRGVVDCVADYKGRLAVIEWKKSDKRKRELAFTYDAPLPLVANLGAFNDDSNFKDSFQVHSGIIVVAYSDGKPADVFRLSLHDCSRQWSCWLRRLQQYCLQNYLPS